MNKYKALGLGVLFVILAYVTLTSGGGVFTWWFAIPAIWYLGLGGYKFWSDWLLVNDAAKARAIAASQPPALLPVTNPEKSLSLGRCLDTAKEFLLREKDRFAGFYLLGVQGVGKSAQMVNMIVHCVLAGNAVIVIDPHIDLVMDCLTRLPLELLHKVFWLNMEDLEHPFGVNLFGAGSHQNDEIKRMESVERIMHIFEAVWADVLKQHHLPRYLRAAVLTLLANPGTTLVDMQRLFTDDAVRAAMLKNVTDQSVLDFWKTQYNDLPYSDRMKRVQPLLGRLELLFMGRGLVRNIIGQADNSIDFRAAIEQKQLIFITLPTKSLTQDARLIGTAIVAQIHAAIFSFVDLAPDKRPGVSLYIDEVQHFSTPDIAELFNEGRKFSLRLIVGHQTRSQLPEYLREATMTAFTKCCFRLTPDDAREMSQLLRSKQTEVRPEDIEPHVIKWLLTYPIDERHPTMFVDRYLRPLQSMRSGGNVEVTPNFSTLSALRGEEITTYKLQDPTLHLDQLLYEVTTSGNPHKPIPSEIVTGFSGCGHTFYNEWRHVLDKEWWLGTDITFPQALVIQKPDGTSSWTRRPDDGREELYHFIFLLRATMAYLAKHPIGKETAMSTAEIAGQLVELPNREMYVRAGNEVARVRTNDMIEPVSASELQERLQTIRQQTHEKYCRPRAEVEASFLKPTEKPDTKTKKDKPIKRWEEL
jgi:hypothetical protein